MTYHWLLDAVIDGVEYRWTSSPDGAEVTLADGSTVTYAAGLGSMTAAAGDPIGFDVTDDAVDWATLAPRLQGRRATLRRWREGDPFERAVVYSTGLVGGVQYDPDGVSGTLFQPQGPEMLGTQVPDALARVDADTFPTAVATDIGPDVGAVYPVIFGYPGWQADSATNVPVVPVPLAQWDANDADTWCVVCEDGSQPITGCRIRNDETDQIAAQTVKRVTDLLGRSILVADFALSNLPKPTTATERAPLFASFFPSSGGGPRAAYDVIVYLLRRWGPLTVDWRRLPEVQQVLEGYLVDTWVDQVVPDPWALIETWLGDLPVESRLGDRGRYLVPSRYILESARVTRTLTLGVDLERDGPVELTEPVNEYVALYRQGTGGDWLGSVVLTGAVGQVLSAPGRTVPGGRVITSARCRSSVVDYGLRPAGEAIEIDWTWDLGTVVRVLEHRASREALPTRLLTVVGDEAIELREGEHIRLVDDELGLDGELAIVDAPPVVGADGITAVLRVPL